MAKVIKVNMRGIEKKDTGMRKHYVFVMDITRSNNTCSTIYRRYNEFFDMQCRLLDIFEKGSSSNRILPFLPGKVLFGRTNTKEVAISRIDPIGEYCSRLIILPDRISQHMEVLRFFAVTNTDKVGGSVEPPITSDGSPASQDITGPVVFDEYIVVADYKSDDKKELTIKKGEHLKVTQKSASGWWFAVNEATKQSGFVSESFLEKADDSDEYLVVPRQTQKESARGNQSAGQRFPSPPRKASVKHSRGEGRVDRAAPKAKQPSIDEDNELDPAWYFDDLDRKSTEKQIKQDGRDGVFLVRKTQIDDPTRPYVLSFLYETRVVHMHIRLLSDNTYTLAAGSDTDRAFESIAKLIDFYKDDKSAKRGRSQWPPFILNTDLIRLPKTASGVRSTHATSGSAANKSSSASVSKSKTSQMCRMKRRYDSRDGIELTVKVGEIVEIVREDDSGWTFVKNKRDETGYVPSDFLEPNEESDTSNSRKPAPRSNSDDASSSPPSTPKKSADKTGGSLNTTDPWYFDDVDREEAERRLRRVNKTGAFVVRQNNKPETAATLPCTLSLLFKDRVVHTQIRKTKAGQHALGATDNDDDRLFASLVELVEFYQNNPVVLVGNTWQEKGVVDKVILGQIATG